MKNYLKKLFANKPDVTPATLKALKDAQKKLELISKQINTMTHVFKEGGSVMFDELKSYSVSTGKKPIRYETGKGCFIYRLPSTKENIIEFFCTFEPKNGETVEYGWHNHPDCDEKTIQLVGTGLANGESVPPFGVNTWKAGEYHNYSMREYGEILVTFTKKLKKT